MTSLVDAQRKRILAEILQVQGLMPLLMKPRNGQRWSQEDRAQIRTHFQRIFELSPFMLAMLLPGGSLTLPLLAWWLDRRRTRRPVNDQQRALPVMKSLGE